MCFFDISLWVREGTFTSNELNNAMLFQYHQLKSPNLKFGKGWKGRSPSSNTGYTLWGLYFIAFSRSAKNHLLWNKTESEKERSSSLSSIKACLKSKRWQNLEEATACFNLSLVEGRKGTTVEKKPHFAALHWLHFHAWEHIAQPTLSALGHLTLKVLHAWEFCNLDSLPSVTFKTFL